MAATFVQDFVVGHHEGTAGVPGGGLTGTGRWTGPVVAASPFTWAVASWNGRGGCIEIEVRAAMAEGWSPWFSYGPWSESDRRHSVVGQTVEGVGRLATDTLLLARPARGWQLRATLTDATLDRLWLATALPGTGRPDSPCTEAWGRELAVPLRSQMIYPGGGRVWCSPTSLAMVMAYWEYDESIPEQVVPGVYDPVYEGHGNWPFNTAYAGARGFAAYVDRLPGFSALERWITRGIPVIASVAYEKEWLPQAPIDQTRGHLLVVRGFTAEGDVIVNDPAARADSEVRLIYPRDLFRRAWLDRGGVVYLVAPPAILLHI